MAMQPATRNNFTAAVFYEKNRKEFSMQWSVCKMEIIAHSVSIAYGQIIVY